MEAVLNFGFVGAVNHNLDLCELVAVGRVCHYQFDVTEVDTDRVVGQYGGMRDNYFYLDKTLLSNVLANIGKPIKVVTCASGDKFVARKEEKDRLRNEFGADICEMELAGLAIACERNNVPLFSVKVVSDKAEEGANESFLSIVEKGIAGYEKILPAILKAVTSGASSLPPVKNRAVALCTSRTTNNKIKRASGFVPLAFKVYHAKITSFTIDHNVLKKGCISAEWTKTCSPTICASKSQTRATICTWRQCTP